MSTIHLQLPDWRHESLHNVVAQQNCSLNLFITLALTEKLTLLTSKEYLEKFKQLGDTRLLKPAQPIEVAKFRELLNKVAIDQEPAEWDKL